MKLLDLNILIYAIDESSPRHQQARRWLEETLSGSETVAFGWSILVGFVRLSTRAAIFARPLTVDEAFDVIDGWLRQPCVTVVHPTERHPRLLRDMLSGLGAAGNLTSDAHLAALAVEHGAELCSTDGDFARFAGLRRVDPLGGEP